MHVVAKQHEATAKSAPATTESEPQQGTTTSIGGGKTSTSQVIRIEDPVEFRRSMPLFSMPANVNVDVVDLGIKKGTSEEITGATDA